MAKRKAKRDPGRPPRAGKAASEMVKLRVTPAERTGWEQQAERAGVSLSEWIRQRCAS